MRALTKYQIEALKLLREGKKPSEIRRRVKMRSRSPTDALERAQRNILLAIGTIRLAVENSLLDKNQIQDLKLLLSKL
jgi:transcriptional regulator